MALQAYAAQFERRGPEATPDEREPGWLRQRRKSAYARFQELGFPTPRDEEWKYTSIAPLNHVDLQPPPEGPTNGVTTSQLEGWSLAGGTSHRLVFVDGHFAPHLSRRRATEALPDSVIVTNLGRALAEHGDSLQKLFDHRLGETATAAHPFAELNTAFVRDGAVVLVPRGVALAQPIELLFVAGGNTAALAVHPRVLVLAGEGSQFRLIERYVGQDEATYLSNGVTELHLQQGAVVKHVKVQAESKKAFHIANMRLTQGRGSSFRSHSISVGGRFVRNDVNAAIDGEGAECTLNGLYLADGRQHVDNHTAIDHRKPHCNSYQTYKGILSGSATAVFNGKIFVRQDAQKTDAKQSNKNLLLSGDAVIHTKPQLEIWADDVKCTHGATIGKLDEDAMFYLRARGIGLEAARELLTLAFANEVLSGIGLEALRDELEQALGRWLPRRASR